MSKLFWRFLLLCRIVESCPNCESAHTGGCLSPESLEYCIVCGDKDGHITGWCWGKMVDPFCWLGHRNVARNLRNLDQRK